jgi:Uri superfamily endonuclease
MLTKEYIGIPVKEQKANCTNVEYLGEPTNHVLVHSRANATSERVSRHLSMKMNEHVDLVLNLPSIMAVNIKTGPKRRKKKESATHA